MIYAIILSLISIAVCMLLWLSKKDSIAFLSSICFIAGVGIACAVIAHYAKQGFDWKIFLFFEFPLYGFLTTAVVFGVIPMIKRIIELSDNK